MPFRSPEGAMPLLNLDHVTTVRMCPLQSGLLSTLVELGPGDESWGFIQYRRHPFRGCLSVLLAVTAFFATPLAVGYLSYSISQWIGCVNPLGIDRGQPILLSVFLWILVATLGFLAAMFVVRITTPRLRVTVWADPDRRGTLIEVRQPWINLFPNLDYEVTDDHGRFVGRIRHRQPRDRFELTGPDGVVTALVTSVGSAEDGMEPGELAAFVVILVLSAFWLQALAVPHERRNVRYSLWPPDALSAKVRQEIGRFDLDPADLSRNQIHLSDTAVLPDRRLMIALATVLSAG